MKLDESLLVGQDSLPEALGQYPLSDLDKRLKLIHFEEQMSVAGLLVDGTWNLMAEDVIYEPLRVDENHHRFHTQETLGESPFQTTGQLWAIDCVSGEIYEENIHFEEGFIQGLTYALDAAIHGGELKPKDYVDWLVQQYKQMKADDKVRGQDKETLLTSDDRLARILHEARILKREISVVRIGVKP